MSYSVGQVAKLAKVTVRTLHYYDQIGLLHPSEQSAVGYRRYSGDDLEHLQRILCYRQLGFSLDRIKIMLDDPATDPREHLLQQHTWLNQRIKAWQQMVVTIEKILEARAMGITLEPHELLETFAETDPAKYHAEAGRRWGDTAPWAQAQRRARSYTKGDWKRIQAESTALLTDLATAYTAGADPTSARAMTLAEAHRQHLERWFYTCGYLMHCGLGDLYVNDPRFAAQFATFAPNLVHFLRAAIYANAACHSSAPTGGSR